MAIAFFYALATGIGGVGGPYLVRARYWGPSRFRNALHAAEHAGPVERRGRRRYAPTERARRELDGREA